MKQAKFEAEKLPWHLKECCDDPDRDRHVRVLAPQLHQVLTQDTAQPSTNTQTLTTQFIRATRPPQIAQR